MAQMLATMAVHSFNFLPKRKKVSRFYPMKMAAKQEMICVVLLG
jgi:hypothetical protein